MRVLRDLDSVTSASIHSTPWKRATLTRWWPSLTKYSPPSCNRLTGGNSCPRRKALSIRFHFSAEALDKGMKFGSNCSCLPTLPTIFDVSTVLLPRYILPLAGTLRRISSGERMVLLVARLSESLFNLPSHARLRATVKSRSTWSSRFIRSTTIITFFLVAPGVKLLYERLDVAERYGPSCGFRRPPSCTTCQSGSWNGRKRPIGKPRWDRPSTCPMSPRPWPAPPR